MRDSHGVYWNGKQRVPLPPGGMEAEVGHYSPPFPVLEDLGVDMGTAEKAAKNLALFQPVTCERCGKTYKTKGGWKYHIDNAVCDPNPPEPAYGEFDDASDVLDSDDGGGGGGGKIRKRKAATKAAAVLAASAAAANVDSGEDPTGGGNLSEVSGDGKIGGKGKRGARGTAAAKAGAAGRPGVRGSGLTAGRYGAAAFTNGSLKSGPRLTGSAVKTSDLVISGQGHNSATLAPSAAEGPKGKLESRLEHAQMRAVGKKARLAMELEPGAWRKGTKASANGKVRAGDGGGRADNARSGGGGDAGDCDVEPPQAEEWKRRSWREVPGLAACRQGAGEAKVSLPAWKVSSFADWAKETGGGGGGERGHLPTVPVKVELVLQGGWDAAGIKAAPKEEEQKEQGGEAATAAAADTDTATTAAAAVAKGAAGAGAAKGAGAGAKKKDTVPARRRVQIPPLE
ncbi:unnamed protein product, partial [Ectocarpus fasciculatus]